jgi:chemotaxis protein methyltransferase CheR
MNEANLSQQEFELFRRLVHRQTGVALGDGKRVLVESRLRRRIRDVGAPTFASN